MAPSKTLPHSQQVYLIPVNTGPSYGWKKAISLENWPLNVDTVTLTNRDSQYNILITDTANINTQNTDAMMKFSLVA